MRKSLFLPTVILSSFAAGAVFVQLGSHTDWWPAADSVPKQAPPEAHQPVDTDVVVQSAAREDLKGPVIHKANDDSPEPESPEPGSPELESSPQSEPRIVLTPDYSDEEVPFVEPEERISNPADGDVPAHYHSEPDEYYGGGSELVAVPGYYDDYYPEYENRYSSFYFSYFDFPHHVYSLHYLHRPFYRSYSYLYNYPYNYPNNFLNNYPYYDSYYQYYSRDFFYIPTRYKRGDKYRDRKHRKQRNHHKKYRLYSDDNRLRDHRYASSDKYRKRSGEIRSSDSSVAKKMARDSLRHRRLVSGDRTAGNRQLRRDVTITPAQDVTVDKKSRGKSFYSDNRQGKSFFEDRKRHLSKGVRADRNALARSRHANRHRSDSLVIPERKQPATTSPEREATGHRRSLSNITVAPINSSRAFSGGSYSPASRALNHRSRAVQQQSANTTVQRARPNTTVRNNSRAQRSVARPAVRHRASPESQVKRQVRQSRSRIRGSHNRIRNHIKR